MRQQQRLGAGTGGSQRSFGAGVAATDDDDIEFAGIVHDGGKVRERSVLIIEAGLHVSREHASAQLEPG